MHPFVLQALVAVRSALRRWLLFSFCCAVAVLLAAGISMSRPRGWTVITIFMPEVGQSDSPGLFSVELGLGGAGMDSPDFYAEFLQTDEALRNVVRMRYARSGGAGDSVSLPELLKIVKADTAKTYAATADALRGRIVVAVVRRAGVVSISVSLPDPQVAQEVSSELLATINDLNTRVRQTRGRREREFAEERLATSRRELTQAEDSLQRFLQSNHQPVTAPSLMIEQMRIQRLVTQRTAVLGSLELTYEQARTDEIRNTPRISVVQPPRASVMGDSRGTVRIAMLTLIATALFLLVLFYFADQLAGGSVRGLVRLSLTRYSQARRGR